MPSTLPRITLITANFNRAHMIGDMMASVARQAFPPVQHLVMDGGSTDGSIETIKTHPGVELHIAKDKGVYDAWNKARPLIRGDWVIYLNTDDMLGDGAFAAYADTLAQRPDARIVTGVAAMQDAGGGATASRSEPAAAYLTLANLRLRGCIINARLISADLVRSTGDLDLALHPASDLDFMIRIARAKPPSAYSTQTTYVYRRHDGSITLGKTAHGNYRTPAIGFALIEEALHDPALGPSERANVQSWRASYLDTLLSRARFKSSPVAWLGDFGRAVRSAPGPTLKHLSAKTLGKVWLS